jgi:hypothetical protein
MALAFAGGAMADTNIDATSTGDLFLNIVDSNLNTSYLFDTGITQAAFNGNGSYSFDLSGDANLTTFLAAVGGGGFYYSVVSGSNASGNHVDVTGNKAPTGTTATKTGNARSDIGAFLSTANGVASSSSTSAIMNTAALSWNNVLNEGRVSTQVFGVGAVPFADQAVFDTTLAFYSVGSTASAFASTWDFASATDKLTYGPQVAAVPLPAPILLLASALGLMGVVSRRKKAAV